MKKTKQELAQDYADLKQKQALGEFASIELAIMKHTFMAGYDAAYQHTAPLIEALQEAKLQIEYLHRKFSKTGSGESVLSRIETALLNAKA